MKTMFDSVQAAVPFDLLKYILLHFMCKWALIIELFCCIVVDEAS